MKKIYSLFFLLFISFVSNSQIINIPDVNFKNKLLSASSGNQVALVNGTMGFSAIDTNNNNEIEVSEAISVKALYVGNSSIQSLEGIKFFTNLEKLGCNNNLLTSLDVSGMVSLQELFCSYNQITELQLENLTNLYTFFCNNNSLTSFNHSFGESITQIDCSNNQIISFSINVTTQYLSYLHCYNNQITSLVINSSVQFFIDNFDCSYNNLSTLNLNDFKVNVLNFNCSHNQLTNLVIYGPTASIAGDLFCNNNLLTELIFPTSNFYSVNCSNNLLTSVFFNNGINLQNIDFTNNLLTTIDLTPLNNSVSYFLCDNNQLTSLFVKGAIDIVNGNNLFFNGNPNLAYICADEEDIDILKNKVAAYGYTCEVNSYCSFTPGGTFYTINGNARFDINSNGCDSNDAIIKNTKLFITNGAVSTIIIPDTSGNYNIPLQQGSHTLTPIVENPSYFNFSPPSATINFPSQTSPFTQNFCTSFNGVHPDLEVVLVPLTNARPGFDSVFKIVYKNKGTISLSGAINLTFQDAYQDYVDSYPVVTSQSIDNLNWSYVNLAPFETREIIVAFNLNTPTENPSLDSGSILNYSVSINGGVTDETPLDNNFVLNQTVVNSLDPNDKTCLEGSSLPVTQVGKYVHYLIRFENNGTANAQNVVVADRIDTTKFDVSSFQTISGSHPLATRITDTNKVEFIYQNINLPFDDATNDGYVVFKIKTKPNLAVNDTFSNTASIYFDYNAPIITNTASTIVASNLLVTSFNDSNVSISPNPVGDMLLVNSKTNISNVKIYDTNGRLVLTQISNEVQSKIDTSNLDEGVYLLKVQTKDGIITQKIVKSKD